MAEFFRFQNFALALLITLTIPAHGAGRYFLACPEMSEQNHNDNNQLMMQQVEFANEIGNELNAYAFRSQADIQILINWLDANIPSEDDRWPPMSIGELNQDGIAKFFIWDLHNAHQQLRLHLALSSQLKGIGPHLQDLESSGNKDLTYPLTGPFEFNHKKQAPLSETEVEIARGILESFWDAPDLGVIDQFIRQMKTKGDLLKQIPSRAEEIANLVLRFEQSRNLSTPKERIATAMRFNDQDWVNFRIAKLQQKQDEHILELWRIIDRYRPILYLTESGIQKPSDLYNSLNLSQKDSIDFVKKVNSKKSILSRFYNKNEIQKLTGWTWEAREARSNMVWFAGRQGISETVLKRRPDLCVAANRLRFQIANRQLLKKGLIFAALAAPTIPALAPAIAMTSFIAGSTSLVWSSYTNYVDSKQTFGANTFNGKFGELPLESQDLKLIDSDGVRTAKHDLAISTMGSLPYVGLPILLIDTIKSLSPAPVH